MSSDLLKIYMQDHYAGSTVGLDLAKRAASNNQGTETGDSLERVAKEIGEDRDALRKVMDEYGASPDPVKNLGAWSMEKVGRLKPNGRLFSYSPLSRVVELEGLVLGITGKLHLWRALEETLGPAYAGQTFATLVERAERQRSELEPLRLAAIKEAFAESRTAR